MEKTAMNDESLKQLKAIKWVLIYLSILISVVIFSIVGFFVYLNWEGKKTPDQEESLKKIQSLQHGKQNTVNPGDLPDVEPEIYNDQDNGEGNSMGVINNLKDSPEGNGSDEDLPDVEPEIYNDRDEGEGNE